MKKLIPFMLLGLLSGCATIPQNERGYTVQSHTVVLGLYIPIFDFLGGQSPTKLALGYITHDMQIVPEGVSASQEKLYEGVLGDNDILSEQTVQHE